MLDMLVSNQDRVSRASAKAGKRKARIHDSLNQSSNPAPSSQHRVLEKVSPNGRSSLNFQSSQVNSLNASLGSPFSKSPIASTASPVTLGNHATVLPRETQPISPFGSKSPVAVLSPKNGTPRDVIMNKVFQHSHQYAHRYNQQDDSLYVDKSTLRRNRSNLDLSHRHTPRSPHNLPRLKRKIQFEFKSPNKGTPNSSIRKSRSKDSMSSNENSPKDGFSSFDYFSRYDVNETFSIKSVRSNCIETEKQWERIQPSCIEDESSNQEDDTRIIRIDTLYDSNCDTRPISPNLWIDTEEEKSVHSPQSTPKSKAKSPQKSMSQETKSPEENHHSIDSQSHAILRKSYSLPTLIPLHATEKDIAERVRYQRICRQLIYKEYSGINQPVDKSEQVKKMKKLSNFLNSNVCHK